VWECVVSPFERPVEKCSIVAVGHRTTVDFRGLFGNEDWINDGQRRVPRPCKSSCDFELIKYGWNLAGEQRYKDMVAVKSACNRGNSVGFSVVCASRPPKDGIVIRPIPSPLFKN